MALLCLCTEETQTGYVSYERKGRIERHELTGHPLHPPIPTRLLLSQQIQHRPSRPSSRSRTTCDRPSVLSNNWAIQEQGSLLHDRCTPLISGLFIPSIIRGRFGNLRWYLPSPNVGDLWYL